MLSCRFLFDMMTGNCDMENEKGLSITELFRVESSQVNSSCVWDAEKHYTTQRVELKYESDDLQKRCMNEFFEYEERK